MKKRTIALVALVFAVVLTGFSVSGTYAKYTSTIADQTDEARVAKWFTNATTTVDFFNDSYDPDTIKTSHEDKTVAPGAKGEYTFLITASQQPETNYTIKVESRTDDDDSDISPLRYWVDAADYASASPDKQFDDLKALCTYLNGLYDGTKVYKYDHELSSETHTIHWEWPWEEDGSIDTPLGEAGSATASITVKVTLLQSNKAAS